MIRAPESTRTRSVLLLMPSAVLIVLLLGAVAVDLGRVHLAERELTAAAEGAANDAVTYGLDESRLRADGEYVLDPTRVEQAARTSLAAGDVGDELTGFDVRLLGPGTVEITVTATVAYLFAPSIPGAPDATVVEATVRATAERR